MWRYRCDSCRTTSLPVRTRAEALAERDIHRRRRHGGHIPDGEHLQRARRPAAGDRRALIAFAVLAAVLLLAALARHLS